MEKISEGYLDNLKKEISDLKIDLSKVEIFSSDVVGVGKSTQIKLIIEKNNKNYIYFPIGGELSKLDIIERLKNLNLKNDSAIHIDLYDTEETKLMEEFLHFILIKKTFGENENIINISKDIEIKIEIPNGYKDYFIVYPILTLFPTKKLSIKNLSPLIVTNEIDSNIQIVANYLKALKNDEIDKIDLYFEKISPLYFLNLKTTKIVKSLPQNECEELIFNEIQEYIFEPNYYEIESFINYLANQFKKLCSNYYLCTYDLMHLMDKSSKIKTFIVKTFIKEAIFIIEGSHSKFLKNQIMINEMNNNISDINLGIENLIQNKEKGISFNKLNYPLFFLIKEAIIKHIVLFLI